MVGLGNSVAFGGDSRPAQSRFWAGRVRQGCFGPKQVGFGPKLGVFGSGQVGFGSRWPGGAVFGKRGSGYDRNVAGQGF